MSKQPQLRALRSFGPRGRERRQALENPGDIDAVLASQWPPRSRDELSRFSRTLRLAVIAPGNALPNYFATRVRRVIQALQNRAARYGQTKTWPVLAPNGRKILFPINDYASTAFKQMVDGYDQKYEKTLIDFVTARLRPGDVFVDVGANVGYISGFAAATGAVVFAMEIQRDLIPLIEQMATINGFDLVRAVHAGASARSGLTMIARIEGNPGSQLEGMKSPNALKEPCSIVDDFVPMMALDDAFLEPGLLPKLVKIDVEGHEIDVLDGAARIIDAARTTFVVEFHPHLVKHFRRAADDLLKPFDPARWAMYQLTDDGLRPIAGMDDVLPDPRDPNPKLVFEPRAT